MENPQPKIHDYYQPCASELSYRRQQEFDDQIDDPIDQMQVFELIRYLNDPEYPLTLQQLAVVTIQRCKVDNQRIEINFTPTIPHCSMAQIIGLMIKVKLVSTLPLNMKITVLITPGTHVKQLQINKQINDKERVAAATENPNIVRILKRGFRDSDRFQYNP